MSERVQQVNHLLKEEVSQFLQENLDGHTGFLTITAVETTNDLKAATVWYGYVGDDLGKVTNELRKIRRNLQTHINKRLTMKSVPKIILKHDNSGEYAMKISKIIDKATHEIAGNSQTTK